MRRDVRFGAYLNSSKALLRGVTGSKERKDKPRRTCIRRGFVGSACFFFRGQCHSGSVTWAVLPVSLLENAAIVRVHQQLHRASLAIICADSVAVVFQDDPGDVVVVAVAKLLDDLFDWQNTALVKFVSVLVLFVVAVTVIVPVFVTVMPMRAVVPVAAVVTPVIGAVSAIMMAKEDGSCPVRAGMIAMAVVTAAVMPTVLVTGLRAGRAGQDHAERAE